MVRDEIEQSVSDEFNAQPFEERRRVGRMMHYERICELKRQKEKLRLAYERHCREIDDMIKRMREAIVESRKPPKD